MGKDFEYGDCKVTWDDHEYWKIHFPNGEFMRVGTKELAKKHINKYHALVRAFLRTPQTKSYWERAVKAGLCERELGLIEGYLEAAEIAEVERQTILDNPSDQSWTEHLAQVSGSLLAKCSSICYRAEQAKKIN